MKKILPILGTLLFLAPFQTSFAAAEKIDGIAAIVNSDAILESDIETRFRIIRDRVPNGIYSADIRRQILTSMIDEYIQSNYANRAGIRVSASDVDRAILSVATKLGTDINGFKNILNQQGIEYNRYRTQIENEILMTNVKRQVIRERIAITEQEIEDFLTSSQSLAQSKDEVRLRHLLVRSKDVNQAKAKIETIAADIQSEDDFIRLAISQSDGSAAVQGGDLGWRPINQLPALFVRELSSSKGPFYGPIQSNAGFHLLWLVDKRVSDVELQKQTKARHILIKPNAIRSDRQAQEFAVTLYKRLQKHEDFATLAKEYSEDEGSALKGGDLDWVAPGTMVPQFEAAMNETPVGQYSRPFRSNFGWHIVQVDGRRNADVSDKVKRANAEKALIAQKQDLVLSNWLDELKTQAFIDIK
ncbi:peptidylprolyl isomerase [Marinomonas sp. 15G1-11]|uniref:Chaperone SurA n=1 Tax=Marinomonas phaeophyticola TaxID=3004091 RepID=A0ABT4JS07_9GAMM|nr:peptidylprolyl isomerase [Marinomonas sp. 15G1-11]MCZ2721163.1 peptidylprolyl isomerase [Marinomonas sp. 15G1-11]